MTEMQDLSIDEILPRSDSKKLFRSFNRKYCHGNWCRGINWFSELLDSCYLEIPKKLFYLKYLRLIYIPIQSEIEHIKVSKGLNTEIIAVLGDIKDKERVKSIITNHSVDLIYHAAAYKHVPIVEYYENITEGIKNNIFGTKTICDVADECNVKKVVVISTDKAVRPTNIMGASKRLAEMVVIKK